MRFTAKQTMTDALSDAKQQTDESDEDLHTLEKRFDTCPVCGREFDHARFEMDKQDQIRPDARECRQRKKYEPKDYVFVHFPEDT